MRSRQRCGSSRAGPGPARGAPHKRLCRSRPAGCASRGAGVPITRHEQTRHRPCRSPALAAGHGQLPGHTVHTCVGQDKQELVTAAARARGCFPFSQRGPAWKNLHLTKYLHEMAIRLPRFNENDRAGSRTVAELMLPSTSSSWAEGAAPAGEMAAPRLAARWHRCCQGCCRAGVGWRVMQE